MAVLDIVGYSKGGTRILAQCKKHPNPVSIEDSFISLCTTFPNPKELFYFAFGGVTKPPAEVRVIDGTFMQDWLETNPNGNLYRKLVGLAQSSDLCKGNRTSQIAENPRTLRPRKLRCAPAFDLPRTTKSGSWAVGRKTRLMGLDG
jgi:hypothetical protein